MPDGISEQAVVLPLHSELCHPAGSIPATSFYLPSACVGCVWSTMFVLTLMENASVVVVQLQSVASFLPVLGRSE